MARESQSGESKTKAGLGLLLDDEYKTSMEAEIRPRITSYLREAKEAKKETCVICLDEDIGSNVMFAVDKCGHRFCINCVKQHIEVKLLDGTFPSCLQHRCKSQLSIERCDKLLTLKLSLMWKQRIREDSTPFTERVYCPHPRCSYLMSKTELSTTCSESSSGFRTCFKCSGSFCVNCKVSWHHRLSCRDYKKSCTARYDDDARLKSLASGYRWRQCGKCQQMIERSVGCGRIKCRCGHVFCYDCGADWYSLAHKGCKSLLAHNVSVIAFEIFCGLLLWLFVSLFCLHYFLS